MFVGSVSHSCNLSLLLYQTSKHELAKTWFTPVGEGVTSMNDSVQILGDGVVLADQKHPDNQVRADVYDENNCTNQFYVFVSVLFFVLYSDCSIVAFKFTIQSSL